MMLQMHHLDPVHPLAMARGLAPSRAGRPSGFAAWPRGGQIDPSRRPPTGTTRSARAGGDTGCDESSTSPRSALRFAPAPLLALLGMVVGLTTACEPVPPPPPPTTTPFPQVEAAYALLNHFRASQGLVPLTRTVELNDKAQSQAQAMASAGTLFHSNLPLGLAPGWLALGENVVMAIDVNTGQAWLASSPPHRANMLSAAFTLVGVGVVEANGLIWEAQDFEQR